MASEEEDGVDDPRSQLTRKSSDIQVKRRNDSSKVENFMRRMNVKDEEKQEECPSILPLFSLFSCLMFSLLSLSRHPSTSTST